MHYLLDQTLQSIDVMNLEEVSLALRHAKIRRKALVDAGIAADPNVYIIHREVIRKDGHNYRGYVCSYQGQYPSYPKDSCWLHAFYTYRDAEIFLDYFKETHGHGLEIVWTIEPMPKTEWVNHAAYRQRQRDIESYNKKYPGNPITMI